MPIADPEQRRAYQREWARRRRMELLDGRPCMRCGSVDDLHLHHLVAGEKASHRITTWARGRAQAEAEKCVVLCAPCHRALHADERRPDCGTDSRYRSGCRCEECRAAHTEANREWRDGRGAIRTHSDSVTGFTARPGSPTPALARDPHGNRGKTAA